MPIRPMSRALARTVMLPSGIACMATIVIVPWLPWQSSRWLHLPNQALISLVAISMAIALKPCIPWSPPAWLRAGAGLVILVGDAPAVVWDVVWPLTATGWMIMTVAMIMDAVAVGLSWSASRASAVVGASTIGMLSLWAIVQSMVTWQLWSYDMYNRGVVLPLVDWEYVHMFEVVVSVLSIPVLIALVYCCPQLMASVRDLHSKYCEWCLSTDLFDKNATCSECGRVNCDRR
ncbi:MAG: hypothetical protein JNK35_07435 [Phycisphaerae bacterium]|nr:hypothetical protein [Phycisphaerae bacterium]